MWQMLFGGGGQALASPIEAIGNVLDKLFTSDEEALSKQIILQRLAQEPSLAQVELNKIEARHRSIFVAGWRPFIGWVCGLALAWHFMLYDIASWITVNWFPHVTALPVLTGTSELITILMALLGLAGLRTAEKFGGRTK